MTRGKKQQQPWAMQKKFAERMGYRWQENTDNPKIAYDFSAFKEGYAMLVKVRVLRNQIMTDGFCEDLLAYDLHDVRAQPFPHRIPSEIWLRTQHERVFRRLRIYDVAVAGIGWLQPDGYTNPHPR